MTDFSKCTKMDVSWSNEDKIEFLKYCANKYELGESPISDAEYDKYYYELEKECPNNSFFADVGGLDEEHIYGTIVKHDFVMGSLSKCPTVEDFREWLRLNWNILNNKSFVLQHKVDGLSLSLIYKNGKLFRATTRGDGEQGVDVTSNAVFVDGVKTDINFSNDIEIRGECFKSRQDFYKNWAKEYKNPRNFTAGSLNQLNSSVTKDRGLSFVAYEVLRHDFNYEIDKVKFLEDLGFNTLRLSTKKTKDGLTIDQLVMAIDIYMKSIDRANLPYDIDGIVVKMNDIKVAKSMGSVCNGLKPKSARAVKFKPEEKETSVIGIEVNTGRSGKLTPIAILSPVDLGGATIQKATLHNFKMLTGNDCVGKGSRVIIAKKGDIIPQIIKVVTSGDKFEIPSKCPSCGNEVKWNETEVDLICDNLNCPSQLARKIEYYLKCLSVKGIGKGILEKLTDSSVLSWDNKPILNSLSEIYYMLDNDRKTEHPFRKYALLQEFFGPKAYQNILDSVKSVKEVPFNIFVEALGIGKIGSMSKEITNIAPTVSDIDKLTIEDLQNIPGFGPIKAKSFIDGWKEMRSEIDILLKYITIKQTVSLSKKLEGKKFCFTGSFSAPSRNDMEKLVGEHGGKLASVGKGLTALVFDGETTKGKYQKAQELGIPIITQQEFLDLIK